MTRYYIGSDNDGHRYVVPWSKRQEFEAWVELDDDDPASWEPPDFAKPIGGALSLLTFTNPEIYGS